MNISLHIERLVLDGLTAHAGQAGRFQAALEAELSRLLAERGLPGVAPGAIPHLAAAPVRLAPGAPAQWGRQIAGSLVASLAPAAGARPVRASRP